MNAKCKGGLGTLTASAKHIQKELTEIITNPPENCPRGDNLHKWVSTIVSPSGSSYQGGIYFLDMQLSIEDSQAPPLWPGDSRVPYVLYPSQGEKVGAQQIKLPGQLHSLLVVLQCSLRLLVPYKL
ncbi:hypothetical protein SELMODRAFT_425552 [Selaginella moellendorffii]|uniref:Uncharacterized protein n=1 Tax=Selaginella moellendorffii TaxID=88036 RepID=D8STH0_SELML|nr:hypothetical protein SELMODRAFT_425552 [Selaginella moellendorffii]